jgi:hypothetical protein
MQSPASANQQDRFGRLAGDLEGEVAEEFFSAAYSVSA